MAYRCATCREIHEDLPDIGFEKPDPWFGVPEGERPRRTVLTADTCILDGEHFFIRGVLELPIKDAETPRFGFGVWVSQKKENFDRYVASSREAIGPFFGWLCSNIAFYRGGTLHMKTMAHFHAGGLRPSIELEPTDHPLAVDQREGITLEKAWAIVHHYWRPD